ncbi:hypothetical protein C8R47DRAFT_1161370, partial [Mycena vitilis]
MSFAFLPFLGPFPYLSSYTLPVQLSFSSSSSQSHTATAAAVHSSSHSRHLHRIQNTGPLIRYGYAAFKSLAWFGFYVHFFILGIGYI